MHSNTFRFIDVNQAPMTPATELLESSFSLIETTPGY